MKSGFKWPVMVLVFLLTFIVIYVVFNWRQHNLVEKPLREQLLEFENVAEVSIDNSSNKNIIINISLKKIEDLPQFYEDIEEVILTAYEKENFKIFLKDKRTPYLNSLYDEIHYSLMEGERLGSYSKMNDEISAALAKEQNLNYYRLWVDQERIYILLSSGANFLCEIIPINLEIES